ncbi:MAG: hypothetical protein A2Y24_00140 [Clostridiales bacterium GWE2_32_10]|nr:MAG: hypothetical protein A2Y24_00140 [Clostridiales bacterium GWE2_32_10]
MHMNKRKVGSQAEEVAEKYLVRRGYEVVEKNYNCSFGEIDIVARKDDFWIFIEVKYRRDLSYGYPVEAVTVAKQKNIRKVAMLYIKHKNLVREKNFRFDVVGILGELNNPRISLIENAF